MKAGISSETGLKLADVPVPRPAAAQVLVKVAAAGMNRADLNAAKGAGVATKASLGKPIGMEWSGEVVECGEAVTDLSVGQRVMCSGSGGYAEYAVADARRCIALDDAADMHSAAVLPLALMTAHDAVMTHGRLQAGQKLLVQGATSAVGLMCLQIGRWCGASAIAGTSTNALKRERIPAFGATHVVDPMREDWADKLIEETGGVDVVIDMVSGAAVNTLMRASAVQGRIVNVGRLGGTSAGFDFDLHAAKRLTYIGVTFRTRSAAEVHDIVDKVRTDLLGAVMAGDLALPIDSSFKLSDAVQAHDHMARNRHFGKILLEP